MMHDAAEKRTPEQKMRIAEKREKTVHERYGVKNVFCAGPVRTKIEDARQERRGDRHWNNSQKASETISRRKAENPDFQRGINEKRAKTIERRLSENPGY